MRPEKESMINEITSTLESSSYIILTDCLGMDVPGFAELRGRLRAAECTLAVVKNRLLARASEGLGWSGSETMFCGPTAIVAGDGDITRVAKILEQFKKEKKLTAVKGGWMDTRLLSVDDLLELSQVPPREILLQRVVGTVAAPLSQTVGVLQQKVATLVYVLQAAAEKKAGNA